VSSYIDLAATGQVLLYSLVAVLAVVGSFSFGALTLARAEGARDAARPAVAYFAVAYVCFVVAAAGVGVGVWFILDK
jgi:hypothetical protein